MAPSPRLSVIIPVLNEAAIAKQYLSQFRQFAGHPNLEILVIDGGSQDETVQLCSQFPVQVCPSPLPGRANQMNYGAGLAQGEWLLFLHLDSILPANFFEQISHILSDGRSIAGAFRLAIDLPQGPYRSLEKLILWRSIYGQLPYGDQGLFLRRYDFEQLGGFAPLPIMEDYQLVQKLKNLGPLAIAPGPILTSGRRWQKLGIIKTTAINQAMVLGYHLGINPQTLAHWYRAQT